MNEIQTMVADVLKEALTCGYSIETVIRVMADAFVGVDPEFDRDAFEEWASSDEDEIVAYRNT